MDKDAAIAEARYSYDNSLSNLSRFNAQKYGEWDVKALMDRRDRLHDEMEIAFRRLQAIIEEWK